MDKPYTELVAQAARAVAGVKDAELRRAAFERVLDDLLSTAARSSGSAPAARPAPANRPGRAVGGARRGRPKAKRGGPQAYVEEMIDEKFFAKPKTIAEVKAELENRGHHIPLTSLSGPLQKLCQQKMLRRQKAKGKGNKLTFAYSNW